ncbi:MAG: hypothetical protein K5739_04435 [Lachnospiraceae bacterium]|nr:hypothetical protein [Lachnospiraceae bacterium]
MSKKKKKNQISSEVKNCFIITAVGLVVGLCLLLYGKLFFSGGVSQDAIQTGSASVVAVEKVERNLSVKDQQAERDKGRTEDEIRYEYRVDYSLVAEDKEFTFTEESPLWNAEPKVGDTEPLTYAIVDGELMLHPETQSTNRYTICGVFLMLFGLAFGGIGLFLKKK